MEDLLAAAVADASFLIAERGWVQPSAATMAEAYRLLGLVRSYRAPSVRVEPDGSVRFEWEAGSVGWLSLVVAGHGQLAHVAVIEEDEFDQSEDFDAALPDWAANLISRLLRAGH